LQWAPTEIQLQSKLSNNTSLTYHAPMLAIYETAIFVEDAAKVWSSEERLEFFAWIANEPEAGAVIKGSGGCRKVRWSRPGMGKQGGARVIYFCRLEAGELCMLLVYAKAERDTIPGHMLKAIRQEIEDDRT
jgi:hypothetical protein